MKRPGSKARVSTRVDVASGVSLRLRVVVSDSMTAAVVGRGQLKLNSFFDSPVVRIQTRYPPKRNLQTIRLSYEIERHRRDVRVPRDVSPARMNVAARGAPSEGVRAVYLKLDLPGCSVELSREHDAAREAARSSEAWRRRRRVVSFRLRAISSSHGPVRRQRTQTRRVLRAFAATRLISDRRTAGGGGGRGAVRSGIHQ
ncbi:hypothetical protein EVAR_94468_1 [Eumeta japonica]|uniref:Uncharacterized protein n=1 Tax=Eumeta variegata TaxID=151549 RepID=A0A4C1UUK7_EUMVA|nr:hypothetical protein EVAR_94468_1 [Eumeta japonica]